MLMATPIPLAGPVIAATRPSSIRSMLVHPFEAIPHPLLLRLEV
jgi:hypothetical protein